MSLIIQTMLKEITKNNTKKCSLKELDTLLFSMLSDYYKEEPVPVEDFLFDEYYLGQATKTLFPIWKKNLLNLYQSRFISPNYLVILEAAIGSGKSLVLGLIACIELGRLLCLKNPASFYGLAPQDILYFVFYTFKRKVAEDGNWQQFLNLLSISPYFREHINPPATPYAGQLTPNLACRVASLSGDLVSKAVIFAGMDEFNEKKNRLTSNTKIYNEMLRRMDSRFMNTTVQPYKLVVCSSPKDESDELGKVIDDIKKYKTKGCKIIDGITAMDTSGLRVNYSGDNFKVYVDPSNSYIMENDNDIRTTEFDGGNVYEVPIEYKRSFEFDIIGAIREILGIRIGSIGKFFRDPKLIDTAFTKKNLTPDTLILPFNIGYEEGVNLLYNKISRDYTFKQAPRCIHIDTALNGDRLGLGASFVVPIQDYAIINTTKDEVFQNAMIINDFSIGIETADGQEIPLDVIVGTLNKLYTEGYPIHIISWDSYQSASIRQPLNRLNMENEYNSMDITKEPYLILKRAILSGRFLGANNYLAKEEAKGLINVPEKNKIDHPTDGSKDIIDGVTGSVYSCYVYLNELLRKFNRHENQKVNYKKQLQRAGFKPIG